MNFNGSASRARDQRVVTPATQLRVQSSLNGQPRPFGYGEVRLAGNLIWTGNFIANYVLNSTAGGKGGGGGGGGGKSGASGGTYNYYTGFALGLSEGPIDSIVQGWETKSAFPIASDSTLGPALTVFKGDYQQAPWSWALENAPPAQNYRGLAYVADDSLFLGTNTELPNFTFSIRFNIADALIETGTVPSGANPALTAQYFNWDYGVAGHFTVPFASPYQIVPSLNPTVLSGLAESIDNSYLGDDWFMSDSSGVIWDNGATNGTVGQPLTRISSGTPSTGQYLVSANGTPVFTFAAADVGQPVVIVTAALSPGVCYVESVTGTTSTGSSLVTDVTPSTAVITPPARVLAGTGLVPGSFVTTVTGGNATGNLSSGSPTISSVAGNFSATAGTPVTDSAGVIPANTTVSSLGAAAITAGANSALTASGVTFNSAFPTTAILDGTAQLTSVASFAGITVGALAYSDYWSGSIAVVELDSGASTVQLASNPAVLSGTAVTVTFVTQFFGNVTSGSSSITGPSSLATVTTSSTLTDSIGAFPAGTSVSSIGPGSITLSANATGNATGDALAFGTTFTLSQPATAVGTTAISLRGAALTQVLSSPTQGEFMLSIQHGSFGAYGFSTADAGAAVAIIDLPDANPADVLIDFLTNPYYGVTQFPLSRIGDLSTYRSYCLAQGLLVSPLVTNQAAANSFLTDLMKATNSELVWSAGYLKVVPYGDQALDANGAVYAPPSAPIYDLDDDDFLDNQGINPHSQSAAPTPDPVTITRLDPADQENDITVEYLDRANIYNPTIVEVKDDAAIETFGLKNNGTKQLHLFCVQSAALASANLMLGRQLIRRTFSFTLGREYILLDPMDIVSITDVNAGLQDQWVRIKEITENDDRSLSIVAEEYLEGTGAAPIIGHQTPAPYVANYNIPAPAALAPIFLDAPVQIGNVLGMETILCTNGSGANWGGCDVYVSSDNVTFAYAGTLYGGTVMGALTASFASGSDPDTTNTLSVDLTESAGVLMPGTQADADQGNTLCLVDSELVTYEQATLTAQWKYNLGKNGSTAGYLRRGFYGTTVASHSSGAPFARLKPGSYFTIGYDSADVGETIYVKLLSFNQWGAGKMSLADATSYSHTLSNPPTVAAGLLPGIIQTPDVALEAATNPTISSGNNGSSTTIGSYVTVASVSLTTIGGTVQVAANGRIGAANGSTEITYQVTRDGTAIYGPVDAGDAAFNVVAQVNDTPAAGAHTYALQIEQVGGTGTWQYGQIDISATEIKR